MNDKVTVSTFQLFEMFPNQDAARKFLEELLWKDGIVCPHCKVADNSHVHHEGYRRCNACRKEFTIRTGTIFERSHIELHKWIHAMYLLLTARKGISSIQLSKQLSITQKSAWFLLHRLREACGNNLESLSGIIEMDETYIGGREENKHKSKKSDNGRGHKGKIPVFGMRQRGGFTKAMPVKNTDAGTLHSAILQNVQIGSTVYTDDWRAYKSLKGYPHQTVNHSAKEYVRGAVHTNGIESIWSVLKRGLHGVYHKASPKHLARYVNEFTFRLNEGNCKNPTMDRIKNLIKATPGHRITYLALKSSPLSAEAISF